MKLQATSSYLPGSQKSLTWSAEMIMLFWEALQCNKRFRSFIIDTDRAHDFVILVLYYAIDQRNDPSKQGLVRMCVFVLQTLSVEPNFGKSLNKTFEGQESLPSSIRIPNFHGSYADYLITVRLVVLLEMYVCLMLSVYLYFDHNQQGQAGCGLPSTTSHHQQHRTIRPESWTRDEFEAAESFHVHVGTQLLVR